MKKFSNGVGNLGSTWISTDTRSCPSASPTATPSSQQQLEKSHPWQLCHRQVRFTASHRILFSFNHASTTLLTHTYLNSVSRAALLSTGVTSGFLSGGRRAPSPSLCSLSSSACVSCRTRSGENNNLQRTTTLDRADKLFFDLWDLVLEINIAIHDEITLRTARCLHPRT
jgi:hypothetical protein